MNETNYNQLLYEKMKAEQDKFRGWLLTKSPPEILNHTYEYTMREDIVMCIQPQRYGLLCRLRRVYALPQVRSGCEELRH